MTHVKDLTSAILSGGSHLNFFSLIFRRYSTISTALKHSNVAFEVLLAKLHAFCQAEGASGSDPHVRNLAEDEPI